MFNVSTYAWYLYVKTFYWSYQSIKMYVQVTGAHLDQFLIIQYDMIDW
jgi:hypothetical protein